MLATGGLALVLAACGGDDAEDGGDSSGTGDEGGEAAEPVDGPTITIGSFNFGESEILGNVYGQALEDAGYDVEYNLNVGAREVLLPELEEGNIDLVPEYVGSALSAGFGGEPTGELQPTLEALTSEFEAIGVQVLEPTDGQNANAYVVAGDSDLASLADLADAGELTLAGPPECEDRDTCYAGIVDLYGASDLQFETIPEGSVRVASLREGQVDVIVLFSTQPVIEVEGFKQLEDPEGIVPVENIVPVVNGEVVDAYGEDMATVLNEVSAAITTEALIDLNGRVELDNEDAEDVAAAFLSEQGLVG